MERDETVSVPGGKLHTAKVQEEVTSHKSVTCSTSLKSRKNLSFYVPLFLNYSKVKGTSRCLKDDPMKKLN
jgi:hypothetical protein